VRKLPGGGGGHSLVRLHGQPGVRWLKGGLRSADSAIAGLLRRREANLHAHWMAEFLGCKLVEIKAADMAAVQEEEAKANNLMQVKRQHHPPMQVGGERMVPPHKNGSYRADSFSNWICLLFIPDAEEGS
jgi:hypothetical protein